MEATESTEVAMAEVSPSAESDSIRIRRADPSRATVEMPDAKTRRRHLAQFVGTGSLPDESGLTAGLAGRLPALVHQVVRGPSLRTPFPLVFDTGKSGNVVRGLPDFLDALAETLGGEGEEADLNRHFLKRVETGLRRDQLPALPLVDVWKEACRSVRRDLRSARIAAFEGFERQTLSLLPSGASLHPCEPATAVLAAERLAKGLATGRGASLVSEAEELKAKLSDLLEVEQDQVHVEPDRLKKATGGALSDAFDFDALSHLLEDAPHAAGMDPDRRTRIESIVATLSGAETLFSTVETASLKDAETAMASLTGRYADLLRALEAARLESMNRYRPDIHGPLLQSWSAGALSRDDIAICPPLLVAVASDGLSPANVAKVLALITDTRPFKVIVSLRATTGVPGELAANLPAAAMATGQTAVLQAVLSDMPTWASGLDTVLAFAGPALVALYAGPASSAHPYMAAAVARDGRAFPSFVYDPAPGRVWADRLRVDGNESPDTDWPSGNLTFESPEGKIEERQVAFTWLDYAVTEPAFESEFVPLSPDKEVDGLVSADLFLQMTGSERSASLPFVWTVTEDGLLEKTVVSGRLLEKAALMLDRWHRLRELGGIENSFAVRAEEKARTRFAKERDAAIDEARRNHAKEMDSAVGALAESIVANIAAGLLDMEAGTPVRAGGATQVGARAAAASRTPSPAEGTDSASDDAVAVEASAEPEEEPISLDEAYIETPRCTACNECTNLNSMIFAYNGEKQAFIKDATAGPYRDIVMAAEKCPVRIIHPGKPTNPSEQGLDDLIERAKPFL